MCTRFFNRLVFVEFTIPWRESHVNCCACSLVFWCPISKLPFILLSLYRMQTNFFFTFTPCLPQHHFCKVCIRSLFFRHAGISSDYFPNFIIESAEDVPGISLYTCYVMTTKMGGVGLFYRYM